MNYGKCNLSITFLSVAFFLTWFNAWKLKKNMIFFDSW